jgi:hypothetical protein
LLLSCSYYQTTLSDLFKANQACRYIFQSDPVINISAIREEWVDFILFYIFLEAVSKVTANMPHRYDSLAGYHFNVMKDQKKRCSRHAVWTNISL